MAIQQHLHCFPLEIVRVNATSPRPLIRALSRHRTTLLPPSRIRSSTVRKRRSTSLCHNRSMNTLSARVGLIRGPVLRNEDVSLRDGLVTDDPLTAGRPRPSMLMAMPHDPKRLVNFTAVNSLPWSVLKISGREIDSGSANASRQKVPSSVWESRQLNTYRLNRSVNATRYKTHAATGWR